MEKQVGKICLLMQRSKAEVRSTYYGDKKEYMRKEENCNDHQVEMARDELNNLRQMGTKKDDRFQQYLSKFQNLIAQSQAGDTPEV